MGKLGDAFWKIPWTTIIGAVMGTVTVWIITDGIIRMEKCDADYAGFVKEFISMSLVIESLAFAVYMGFRPKEELTRWSDSMIVYFAMALVVPASVFFSVIALVKVWENFLFDSILLHSALATWFTYTGIYCLMLKTARKAMIGRLSSFNSRILYQVGTSLRSVLGACADAPAPVPLLRSGTVAASRLPRRADAPPACGCGGA